MEAYLESFDRLGEKSAQDLQVTLAEEFIVFAKQYFPHHIRSVIKHEEKLEFVHCLNPKGEFAQICAETKCLVAPLCSGEFLGHLFSEKRCRKKKKRTYAVNRLVVFDNL